MFSFVHETFLTIDSTANRAKYNKAQARATMDHILQVWWPCVCVCVCVRAIRQGLFLSEVYVVRCCYSTARCRFHFIFSRFSLRWVSLEVWGAQRG